MPDTPQLVEAKDVAHLHSWTWEERPIAIWGLWSQTRFVSCLHVFNLVLDPEGEDPPLQVLGFGGIATEKPERRRGHSGRLLRDSIWYYARCKTPPAGILLNGRPADTLWEKLGFRDVLTSPTAPDQRLWWLPIGGTELPCEFTILPEGFHW